MNEQVQKELFTRLDAIAAKLGVAAAHLWNVLIRQAYVEGIANILLFVVLVLVSAYLANKASKVYAGIEAEGYNSADGQWFTFWTVSLISLCLSIWAICYLYDGVISLANPEYFALSKILQLLK